jgi:formate hydrogenlyase subunit 6
MDRKEFLTKSIGLIVFGGLSMTGFAAAQTEKEKKYKVVAQRCDGCGHCFRSCKDKALLPRDGKAVIDQQKCKGCGECTRFCRRMAIIEQDQKG